MDGRRRRRRRRGMLPPSTVTSIKREAIVAGHAKRPKVEDNPTLDPLPPPITSSSSSTFPSKPIHRDGDGPSSPPSSVAPSDDGRWSGDDGRNRRGKSGGGIEEVPSCVSVPYLIMPAKTEERIPSCDDDESPPPPPPPPSHDPMAREKERGPPIVVSSSSPPKPKPTPRDGGAEDSDTSSVLTDRTVDLTPPAEEEVLRRCGAGAEDEKDRGPLRLDDDGGGGGDGGGDAEPPPPVVAVPSPERAPDGGTRPLGNRGGGRSGLGPPVRPAMPRRTTPTAPPARNANATATRDADATVELTAIPYRGNSFVSPKQTIVVDTGERRDGTIDTRVNPGGERSNGKLSIPPAVPHNRNPIVSPKQNVVVNTSKRGDGEKIDTRGGDQCNVGLPIPPPAPRHRTPMTVPHNRNPIVSPKQNVVVNTSKRGDGEKIDTRTGDRLNHILPIPPAAPRHKIPTASSQQNSIRPTSEIGDIGTYSRGNQGGERSDLHPPISPAMPCRTTPTALPTQNVNATAELPAIPYRGNSFVSPKQNVVVNTCERRDGTIDTRVNPGGERSNVKLSIPAAVPHNRASTVVQKQNVNLNTVKRGSTRIYAHGEQGGERSNLNLPIPPAAPCYGTSMTKDTRVNPKDEQFNIELLIPPVVPRHRSPMAFPEQNLVVNTGERGDVRNYTRCDRGGERFNVDLSIPPEAPCHRTPMAIPKQNTTVNTGERTDGRIYTHGGDRSNLKLPIPPAVYCHRTSIAPQQQHVNLSVDRSNLTLPIPPVVPCIRTPMASQKENINVGRLSQITAASDVSRTTGPIASIELYKRYVLWLQSKMFDNSRLSVGTSFHTGRPFDSMPGSNLPKPSKLSTETSGVGNLYIHDDKGGEQTNNNLSTLPAALCNGTLTAYQKENSILDRVSQAATFGIGKTMPLTSIITCNGSKLVPQPKLCDYSKWSVRTSFNNISTIDSIPVSDSLESRIFGMRERESLNAMPNHGNAGNVKLNPRLSIPPVVPCNETLMELRKIYGGNVRLSQTTTSDTSTTTTSATATECFTDPRFIPFRCIAKIRYYDEEAETYGPFYDILSNGTTPQVFKLQFAGKLIFYPRYIPDGTCKILTENVKQCKLRQYYFGPSQYPEPRVHVLLHSDAGGKIVNKSTEGKEYVSQRNNPGYQYHGVKLKAEPLPPATPIDEFARALAKKYSLPDNKWNIGVDVVVYRDGRDRIGWHADDTQGESIILCVVIESDSTRTLKVKPKCNKGKKKPSHGDEEVWLYPSKGDAYEMDGVMQQNYVHSLAGSKENSRRSALIFRQGRATQIIADTGTESSTSPPKRLESTLFGHPKGGVLEGSGIYLRKELYQTFTHRADQSGVNGNHVNGCDSIVVSRQDPLLREADGLSWIRYTSSSNQGGKALFKSYSHQKPVRVIRSSQCKTSKFAPLMAKDGKTQYRYDGLYKVVEVLNHFGEKANKEPPSGHIPYTFLLVRYPQQILGNTTDTIGNKLGIEDLWIEVCKSQCVHHPHEKHSSYIPIPPLPVGTLKTDKSQLKMGQRVMILVGKNKQKWAIFLGLKNDIANIIVFQKETKRFCRQSIWADRLMHADPERKKRKAKTRFENLDYEMNKVCNFEYSCSLSESGEALIIGRNRMGLCVGQKLLVLQNIDNLAYWATLLSIEHSSVIIEYDGRTGKSQVWVTQIIHGIVPPNL